MIEDRFNFRAWNKERKTMLADLSLCYEGEDFWGLCRNPNFVIMQSTGLKDKNGKLIFEGDIVEDEKGNKGYVNWYDGDAKFGLMALDQFSELKIEGDFDFLLTKNLRVADNIYSNPELLNQENNEVS